MKSNFGGTSLFWILQITHGTVSQQKSISKEQFSCKWKYTRPSCWWSFTNIFHKDKICTNTITLTVSLFWYDLPDENDTCTSVHCLECYALKDMNQWRVLCGNMCTTREHFIPYSSFEDNMFIISQAGKSFTLKYWLFQMHNLHKCYFSFSRN